MKTFAARLYILVLLFAFAAGLNAFMGFKYLEAPFQREVKHRIDAELEHIVGNISGALVETENSLRLAASWVKVEPDEPRIYQFLAGLLKENPSYLAIYLGTSENNLIYVNGWSPPEDFDVKSRPWYRTATREGRLIITEPYMDAAEERWVLTMAKPVYDEEQNLLAVVGVDQSLDSILDFLDKEKALGYGFSLIFNRTGELIVHSRTEFFEEDYGNLCDMLDCGILVEADGLIPIMLAGEEGYLRWRALENSGLVAATFVQSKIFFDQRVQTKQLLRIIMISLVAGILLLSVFQRVHVIKPMGEFERDIMAISVARDVTYRVPQRKNQFFESLRENLNQGLDKGQEHFQYMAQQREELSAAYSQLKAHEQELQTQYQEIKQRQDQIRVLADRDALTGLLNRRRFEEDLQAILDGGGAGAVFLLDIDDFKNINDTQGHGYGDQVLVELAEIFNKELPQAAMAYRFGGDEFLILLECQIDPSKIRSYVDRIGVRLNKAFPMQSDFNRINASMGVVRFPGDGNTVTELLMKADLTMYNAKKAGKNRYLLFESHMAASFNDRVHLEHVLMEAIQTESFSLVYQPIVETTTGEIAYFEALLRLKGHQMAPSVFIPVAEESNLILPIGRWVIKDAIRQLGRWRRDGKQLKPIAINLSPKQFFDPGLANFIMLQLAWHDIDPSLLELEITEGVLIHVPAEALQIIKHLRELGFKIALDDYGAGYSSINYITQIPVDRIKLHESVIDKTYENFAVVEGLIAIAHGLKIPVVAEGVERPEIARLLCKAGCDYMQGYLFTRPVVADQAGSMLDMNYKEMLR